METIVEYVPLVTTFIYTVSPFLPVWSCQVLHYGLVMVMGILMMILFIVEMFLFVLSSAFRLLGIMVVVNCCLSVVFSSVVMSS